MLVIEMKGLNWLLDQLPSFHTNDFCDLEKYVKRHVSPLFQLLPPAQRTAIGISGPLLSQAACFPGSFDLLTQSRFPTQSRHAGMIQSASLPDYEVIDSYSLRVPESSRGHYEMGVGMKIIVLAVLLSLPAMTRAGMQIQGTPVDQNLFGMKEAVIIIKADDKSVSQIGFSGSDGVLNKVKKAILLTGCNVIDDKDANWDCPRIIANVWGESYELLNEKSLTYSMTLEVRRPVQLERSKALVWAAVWRTDVTGRAQESQNAVAAFDALLDKL